MKESVDPRYGRMALQNLESLQRAGLRQLAKPSGRARKAEAPANVTIVDKQAALAALKDEAARCTRCPVLVANRTQVVLGVGNPDARLTFYGEAPGADEDRIGEPFVGAAGKLLNSMITNACGMQREDVFICNTVCCRPPNNRNPDVAEIDNCRRFAERQLEIVNSPFICCLGKVAASALLRTDEAVGKLRGRVHTWRNAKVIVTYHPAYLLRSPGQKRAAWEDLKLLLREMGCDQ